MDFSKHLFRAHASGHLMTEPRGKSNKQLYDEACALLAEEQGKLDAIAKKESVSANKKQEKINKVKAEIARLEPIKHVQELSDTTKKHLVHIYASTRYGRRTDIHNRYITKGLQVEEDSMTLFCRLKKQIYFKNEQHFKNDYIQGTPDIVYDEVVDLKSSWDLFTFLPKTVEEINDLYYWQGQCYLALTGAKIFRLAYCLVNTPVELIEQEKRSLLYKMGGKDIGDELQKGYDEIERNAIYDDIPIEERMIEIVIERNDEDIERLYKRIEQCRVWLNDYAAKQELRFASNKGSIPIVTLHDTINETPVEQCTS